MKLRRRGIYYLPNGRELVVLDKPAKGDVLFRLSGWEFFEASEYEVSADGRLSSHGNNTAWRVNHLLDTGRTAPEFILPSQH